GRPAHIGRIRLVRWLTAPTTKRDARADDFRRSAPLSLPSMSWRWMLGSWWHASTESPVLDGFGIVTRLPGEGFASSRLARTASRFSGSYRWPSLRLGR